jgi:uncharacterized tellurite resistance protein B-like protein
MNPLTVSELTHDETLALISLLKRVIEADRRLAVGESVMLQELADRIGRHSFNQLADESHSKFPTLDALKAHLATIDRPAARALIYQTAKDMANADNDRAPGEDALLGWLAQLWVIEA